MVPSAHFEELSGAVLENIIRDTASDLHDRFAGRIVLVRDAVDLSDLRRDDRLVFDGWTFLGPLTLKGARLGGLSLRGARLLSGLELDEARVEGSISMEKASVIASSDAPSLSFNDATVEGSFRLTGAVLLRGRPHAFKTGARAPALSGDRARVRGAFLVDDADCRGLVRLRGAELSGHVLGRNSTFDGDGGRALDFATARITGGLFLEPAVRAYGEVRLRAAVIDGPLELQGGTFVAPTTAAVDADGARVSDWVILSQIGDDKDDPLGVRGDPRTSVFQGRFTMRSAAASGVQCGGGVFRNTGGTALDLSGSTVGGLFLEHASSFDGNVRLLGLNIESVLLWDARIAPGHELLLRGSRMGSLAWQQAADDWETGAFVDFRGATFESLGDDDARPISPPDAVQAIIKRLSETRVPSSAPFDQLASVLARDGRALEAREVLIAKHENQRRRGLGSRNERWRSGVFRWLLGYGYKPALALVWWGALAGVAMLLALIANDAGAIQPSEVQPPAFNVPLYAFDRTVPFFDAGQASGYSVDNGWLALGLGVCALGAWVFATLTALSLAQLVRQDHLRK